MSHRNMSSASSDQDRKRDEEIAAFIDALLETALGGYRSLKDLEDDDDEFEGESESENSQKSSRKNKI